MRIVLALFLFIVSIPAFATVNINANKPWALVMRDANGNYVYARDLLPNTTGGAISGAGQGYKVGISGVNGYNNIAQDANGVVLRRTVPLVGESGIIKGTEVQLAKSVAGEAADSIIARPAAVSAAGRFLLRNAVPVVGAGILAYQLYNALSDDGITYSSAQNTLVKRYNQNPDVQYVIQGKSPLPGTGFSPTSIQSCPAGTQVSGYAGLDACFVSTLQQSASPHIKYTKKSYRTSCDGKTSGSCTFFPKYSVTGDYPPYGDNEFQITINIVGINCPAGYTASGSTCYADFPATDQQIEDGLSNQPVAQLPDLVQEIADKGDGTIDVPKSSPSSISFDHPDYATSPTVTQSTTTNPDGSTTTRRTEQTQKITPNTSGDNLGNQQVTMNITNVTNIYKDGDLIEHTDQDQPQQPVPNPSTPSDPEPSSNPCDDGGCEFTDADMPAQPTLYTQKYPDGIVGVWNAKWPQIQNTAFVNGIKNMFPTLSDNGSCPAWGLDMNIMPSANYGYQTFGVSCTIWQVVGLIILTSACFTAWRIVF